MRNVGVQSAKGGHFCEWLLNENMNYYHSKALIKKTLHIFNDLIWPKFGLAGFIRFLANKQMPT